MEFSKKPGVLGVLDTHAECMMLQDRLDDYSQPFDAAYELSRAQIYTRFAAQVMHEGWSPFKDDEMNSKPQFEVLPGDETFVLSAAEAVLNEASRPERAFNKFLGRTKAARSIVSYFEANNH